MIEMAFSWRQGSETVAGRRWMFLPGGETRDVEVKVWFDASDRTAHDHFGLAMNGRDDAPIPLSPHDDGKYFAGTISVSPAMWRTKREISVVSIHRDRTCTQAKKTLHVIDKCWRWASYSILVAAYAVAVLVYIFPLVSRLPNQNILEAVTYAISAPVGAFLLGQLQLWLGKGASLPWAGLIHIPRRCVAVSVLGIAGAAFLAHYGFIEVTNRTTKPIQLAGIDSPLGTNKWLTLWAWDDQKLEYWLPSDDYCIVPKLEKLEKMGERQDGCCIPVVRQTPPRDSSPRKDRGSPTGEKTDCVLVDDSTVEELLRNDHDLTKQLRSTIKRVIGCKVRRWDPWTREFFEGAKEDKIIPIDLATCQPKPGVQHKADLADKYAPELRGSATITPELTEAQLKSYAQLSIYRFPREDSKDVSITMKNPNNRYITKVIAQIPPDPLPQRSGRKDGSPAKTAAKTRADRCQDCHLRVATPFMVDDKVSLTMGENNTLHGSLTCFGTGNKVLINEIELNETAPGATPALSVYRTWNRNLSEWRPNNAKAPTGWACLRRGQESDLPASGTTAHHEYQQALKGNMQALTAELEFEQPIRPSSRSSWRLRTRDGHVFGRLRIMEVEQVIGESTCTTESAISAKSGYTYGIVAIAARPSSIELSDITKGEANAWTSWQSDVRGSPWLCYPNPSPEKKETYELQATFDKKHTRRVRLTTKSGVKIELPRCKVDQDSGRPQNTWDWSSTCKGNDGCYDRKEKLPYCKITCECP